MNFYAASYGPRYGDPSCTFVSLKPGVAENAADKGANWERGENWTYDEQAGSEGHEGPCDETGCPYCDIVAGMEFAYRAKDLFSAAELKEHRSALRRGEVVALYR